MAFRVLDDLARDDRDWSAVERLRLATSMIDTRRIKPIAARFDATNLFSAAAYGALAALGYYIALHASALPLRWLGGVMLIYGVADAGNALALLLFTALGQQIPKQRDTPIVAQSIGAF